jgi:hypothetical protein
MAAFGDSQQAMCAMHGGGSALAAMSGAAHVGKSHVAAMQADAMHGVADMHADAAAHDAGARSNGSDEQDSHRCDCTCIGDCSVSAPAATVPALPTIRVAIISAQPLRALDVRTSDTPPASADRRLPFSNGPPATRLS